MERSTFLTYILILTSGIVYFHSEAQKYFSRPDPYIVQIQSVEKKLERQKFINEIQKQQFEEFKAYVATLLPDFIKSEPSQEKNYPLRSLASVVQKPSSSTIEMQAQLAFEEAKSFFRDKNWVKSVSEFEKFVRKYPFSAHLPEVYFFLVESYYQMKEFEPALRYTKKMVEVYPELELTGYALLRAARIYEVQNRHEDSIAFYELVIKNFPQRELASAAEKSIRAFEL